MQHGVRSWSSFLPEWATTPERRSAPWYLRAWELQEQAKGHDVVQPVHFFYILQWHVFKARMIFWSCKTATGIHLNKTSTNIIIRQQWKLQAGPYKDAVSQGWTQQRIQPCSHSRDWSSNCSRRACDMPLKHFSGRRCNVALFFILNH